MNAINCIAKIHGAGAERIARAAGHEARQIRLALDHFRWRMPIRPFGFSADLQKALPGKSLAPDSDAVANRVRRILNEVEMALQSIDDDDPGRRSSGRLAELP